MTPASPSPAALPLSLLRALEAIGTRPALVWYGGDGRIELSGHVLANWVIKSANHLGDEIAPAEGDDLVLALPPHWKRLVLALTGWSLGLHVHVAGSPEDLPSAPTILATDSPESPLAADADEVLALAALSLSPRFPAALGPLVRDWVQEVRGSGDALGVDLGTWSGPAPLDEGVDAPVVLLDGDGADAKDAATALGAWLRGGRVIGPRAAVDADRARAEGVEV